LSLQSIVDLQGALQAAADDIDQLQPLYQRMPLQFVKMASSLPTKAGVHRLSDVIGELQKTNADWLGDNYHCYRKALEILHAVVVFMVIPCFQVELIRILKFLALLTIC